MSLKNPVNFVDKIDNGGATNHEYVDLTNSQSSDLKVGVPIQSITDMSIILL